MPTLSAHLPWVFSPDLDPGALEMSRISSLFLRTSPVGKSDPRTDIHSTGWYVCHEGGSAERMRVQRNHLLAWTVQGCFPVEVSSVLRPKEHTEFAQDREEDIVAPGKSVCWGLEWRR